MVEPRLQWHPSLYAGSAPYYAIGRVSYPTAFAEALAEQLGLTGPAACWTSAAVRVRSRSS